MFELTASCLQSKTSLSQFLSQKLTTQSHFHLTFLKPNFDAIIFILRKCQQLTCLQTKIQCYPHLRAPQPGRHPLSDLISCDSSQTLTSNSNLKWYMYSVTKNSFWDSFASYDFLFGCLFHLPDVSTQKFILFICNFILMFTVPEEGFLPKGKTEKINTFSLYSHRSQIKRLQLS